MTRMGATYWHRRASLDMGSRGVLEGTLLLDVELVTAQADGNSFDRLRTVLRSAKREESSERIIEWKES